MSNRYLEILAVQYPFPFDTDGEGRTLFSVNFQALAAAPVDEWEEDIVKILAAKGLATLDIDTFIGRSNTAPPGGAGPYTTILNTGGGQPDDTHNDDMYDRLSAQVVVRAASYKVARTRALAIYRALHGVRNTTVA